MLNAHQKSWLVPKVLVPPNPSARFHHRRLKFAWCSGGFNLCSHRCLRLLVVCNRLKKCWNAFKRQKISKDQMLIRKTISVWEFHGQGNPCHKDRLHCILPWFQPTQATSSSKLSKIGGFKNCSAQAASMTCWSPELSTVFGGSNCYVVADRFSPNVRFITPQLEEDDRSHDRRAKSFAFQSPVHRSASKSNCNGGSVGPFPRYFWFGICIDQYNIMINVQVDIDTYVLPKCVLSKCLYLGISAMMSTKISIISYAAS